MSAARSASSLEMASSRCRPRVVSSSLLVAGIRSSAGAASSKVDAGFAWASPEASVGPPSPGETEACPALHPLASDEPQHHDPQARRPSHHASMGSVTRSTCSTSSNARISARQASVGRSSRRSLAHAATAALEDRVGHLLDVDAMALEHRQHVGERAHLVHHPDDQLEPRRRRRRDVDHVRHGALEQERAHHPHRLRRDRQLRLVGCRRDVRRPVDEPTRGRAAEQPRVGEGLRAAGLVGVHVEGGADAARVDRLEQRGHVDQVGPRRVDEHGVVGHQPDDAPVHDLPRALDQRQVQRQRVALGGQLVDRRRVGDAELVRPRRRERSAPREHVQPHAARRLPDLPPDRAHPRDPQRATVQPLGLAVFLALPLARLQRRHRVGDAAVERHEHADDQLGHGRRVLPGAVGHVDAATAGGVDVDGVVAGAGADDEVQLLGALDGRRRHLGRSHDEHAHALQPLLEALLGELGFVHDLERERTKLLDGAGVELVGDEQTHGGGILAETRVFRSDRMYLAPDADGR